MNPAIVTDRYTRQRFSTEIISHARWRYYLPGVPDIPPLDCGDPHLALLKP
jgi:hypothetical protein